MKAQNFSLVADIRTALLASAPILVGYLVMGLAWGLLAHEKGFSLANALLAAVVVFSGSLQFLIIAMLAQFASAEQIILAAALLNSRYFFYILGAKAQLDALSAWPRALAAWTLNDESFAVISAQNLRARAMFLLLIFTYSYWIIACCVGFLGAAQLSGDFSDLAFSSVALFIVLAYDLVAKNTSRTALAIAAVSIIAAYFLLASEFMLLAAVCMALILLLIAHKRRLL